jgi:TonB family protein
MSAGEILPRAFGPYILTAALGEDALGRVYRALRIEGDRGFARLRILESPELAEEALLEAIEQNGEIHQFLKNPAIARGVRMDAAGGTPYIAWSEENGRTLDALLEKVRASEQTVPAEHALLIVERVATALDHAYNTTVDEERTLHGLVWPGFVSLSDDGEARLTGFGLASGVLPSLQKPRIAREIGQYLAPEERLERALASNSDVYSVGALLFELLVGKAASPADPLADLRRHAGAGQPIPSEIETVLRMCLSPQPSRYRSSGDLRRELGRLLFSGAYSPSTFNLAFFLNGLFREEIEKEARERAAEAQQAESSLARPPEPPPPPAAAPPSMAPRPPAVPSKAAPSPPRPQPPTFGAGRSPSPVARRRGPLALIGAVVAATAVAGGIYVIARRPGQAPAAVTPAATLSVPTVAPATPVPSGPTTEMSEAQFKDEVSRRLAQELKKLEEELGSPDRNKPTPELGRVVEVPTPQPEPVEPAPPDPGEEVPAETIVAVAPTSSPPLAPTPSPTAPAVREGDLVPIDEVDAPPRLQNVVKPAYPLFALKSKIGGIVILRVLVSETGKPLEVEVTRGARAGLTEAAVSAVRKWSFQPARKAGVAVRTWTVVPIPFEP